MSPASSPSCCPCTQQPAVTCRHAGGNSLPRSSTSRGTTSAATVGGEWLCVTKRNAARLQADPCTLKTATTPLPHWLMLNNCQTNRHRVAEDGGGLECMPWMCRGSRSVCQSVIDRTSDSTRVGDSTCINRGRRALHCIADGRATCLERSYAVFASISKQAVARWPPWHSWLQRTTTAAQRQASQQLRVVVSGRIADVHWPSTNHSRRGMKDSTAGKCA